MLSAPPRLRRGAAAAEEDAPSVITATTSSDDDSFRRDMSSISKRSLKSGTPSSISATHSVLERSGYDLTGLAPRAELEEQSSPSPPKMRRPPKPPPSHTSDVWTAETFEDLFKPPASVSAPPLRRRSYEDHGEVSLLERMGRSPEPVDFDESFRHELSLFHEDDDDSFQRDMSFISKRALHQQSLLAAARDDSGSREWKPSPPATAAPPATTAAAPTPATTKDNVFSRLAAPEPSPRREEVFMRLARVSMQRRRNQAVAPKQFAGVRTLAPSPPAARRPVTSRDPVAPKGMWRSLSNSKRLVSSASSSAL